MPQERQAARRGIQRVLSACELLLSVLLRPVVLVCASFQLLLSLLAGSRPSVSQKGLASDRGVDGQLKINAANIVNHYFTLAFLERVASAELPYAPHRTHAH